MLALIQRIGDWFAAIERARVAEREVAFLRDLLRVRTGELLQARSKNVELRRQLFGVTRAKGLQ
jgi:hypothetical protein